MLRIVVFLFLPTFINSPQTTKNRELLFHDGYEYRQKGQSKNGDRQFWACVRNNCNGRAHTPFGRDEPIHIVTGHNHPRDAANHESRLAKEAMKENARQQPEAQPRNIIAQHRTVLNDEARMHLPLTSSLLRTIDRQREEPNRQNVDANELQNIEIGIYRNDFQNNPFLLYDSRDDEPDDVVFFLFGTENGLQRLRNYRNWASDGTFKIVSKNMLQLYTINALIEHSSVPAVFSLMANKAQATYVRVLQALYARLGVRPTSIMLDFEQAAKNAYLQIYGNDIQIRFCLFHLGQSINRKIKKEKLLHYYTTNDEFKILVRSLASLSFIQELQVIPAFNLLRQKAIELEIQPVQNAGQPLAIFDYFGSFISKTYVLGHRERHPLFPINTWNHHDSVMQDLARTNNAQEGFHLALIMQFSSVHPPLSNHRYPLKEERIAADKLRQYELDPTQGIRIRERKKIYKDNDLAIRNLVEGYDAIDNPNDDETLTHLRALQYRLMRNDFENWDDPNDD